MFSVQHDANSAVSVTLAQIAFARPYLLECLFQFLLQHLGLFECLDRQFLLHGDFFLLDCLQSFAQLLLQHLQVL